MARGASGGDPERGGCGGAEAGVAGHSRELGQLEARLRRQEQALERLGTDPVLRSGELERALRAVAEVSAEVLAVDRVGIWELDPAAGLLKLLDRWERGVLARGLSEEIETARCPSYLAALGNQRVVAVGDTARDSRLAELRERYLQPVKVGALLDAAIRAPDGLVGVLCFDQLGSSRCWTADERLFAGSIGDLVSALFERRDSARARSLLRAQQLRLSAVFQNLSHVVFYETGGDREFVSDNILDLVGISQAECRADRTAFPRLIHPDDQAPVRRRVGEWHRAGEPGVLINEFRVVRPDGKVIWIEDHMVVQRPVGARQYMTGVMIDVTGRKEAEAGEVSRAAPIDEQLLQLQKMEAVGNLAGGVAHDFNNLLTGILGYASLLQQAPEATADVRRAAEVIEDAAQRAAELTDKLQGFARQGKHRDLAVDMHAAIGEVIELLSRTLDKKIEIHQRLEAARSTVFCEPTQMEHVLLNLALNARDAMPGGGRLTFASRTVVLDERDSRIFGELAAGEYLVLSVVDTGPGVPAKMRARIFEPFFTTKQQGKGTGMGLAMVYGIVTNHGGTVKVLDGPSGGALFDLWLPLCEAEPLAPPGTPGAESRSAHILVVDDEPVVRDVACRMLEHLGYRAEGVASAAEAEAAYREHGDEIDLVLIDLIMPVRDGGECFRALKRIDPGVRAVLTTGYCLDGTAQAILEEGMLGFARKPFQLPSFSEVISTALG